MLNKLASIFGSMNKMKTEQEVLKEEHCVRKRNKKTEEIVIPGLIDVVFSWSLAHVLNKNLFKDEVKYFSLSIYTYTHAQCNKNDKYILNVEVYVTSLGLYMGVLKDGVQFVHMCISASCFKSPKFIYLKLNFIES